MSTTTTLPTFSEITEGAYATPSYLNAKFNQVVSLVSSVNASSRSIVPGVGVQIVDGGSGSDLTISSNSQGWFSSFQYGLDMTGATDSTSSWRALISAATGFAHSTFGGAHVELSAGTILLTSMVTGSDDDRVTVRGAGAFATTILFNPSSDVTCMRFRLSGTTGVSPLFGCQLQGVGFKSTNAAQKTAIELIDCSTTLIDDVDIHNSWSGASASIGLWLGGREMPTIRRFRSAADKPVVIGLNPYRVQGSVYDADHYHFEDCWLVSTDTFTNYNVEIASGAQFNAITFDGYQSWNQGLGGIKWEDSTGTGVCNMLRLSNIRLEQTGVGGWFSYISAKQGLVGVTIENCAQDGGDRGGIYLGVVNGVVINNFQNSSNTSLSLKVHTGTEAVTLRNFYAPPSTVSIGGMLARYWQENVTGAVDFGVLESSFGTRIRMVRPNFIGQGSDVIAQWGNTTIVGALGSGGANPLYLLQGSATAHVFADTGGATRATIASSGIVGNTLSGLTNVVGPAGTALLPAFGFSSESSLGFYRSATSTLASSYGTVDLSASHVKMSSTSSLIGAFVVQGSSSSFTRVVWADVKANDIVWATPTSLNANVSSLSSGIVPHSVCTQAGQFELRLSNVSTLAQNVSSRTWFFTRVTPF